MTAYVVMDRPGDQTGSATQFVRDRFSVLAIIAPVIWLAWHRLWVEAFAALAAAICIAALGSLAGFENSAPLLSVVVSIFVATEGPQLRIAALERRGFRQMTTVEADNAADAELIYFSDVSTPKAKPTVAAAGRRKDPVHQGPWAAGPALGLLDYPGNS